MMKKKENVCGLIKIICEDNKEDAVCYLNIKFDFVCPYAFMAERMFTMVANAGPIIVSLMSSNQSRGNLLVKP